VEVRGKVGDAVRAGQVLAYMHSHDVHESRAAYRRAVAELARLQSVEAFARRSRDRARRLLELKAASQEQAELAESELRNAQGAVANAETELEKARLHLVEFLEVPLEDDGHDEKGHSKEKDYIPVKAPSAGIVLDRHATAGSVVSTGEHVFSLTDLSTVWVIAAVNEADLSAVRVGRPVRVSVRAFPGVAFPGRIQRLGESLDPATRTLQVRALVPNPGARLRPEMYATVELEQSASRDSIVIPEAAAQDVNGHRVVFVRTALDRFVPRAIQIARTMNGQMEITDGLRAGDQIAVKGSFLLKTQLLKSSLEGE
jgi:membrane fusion protein, heavy metal efflux system